MSLRVIAPALTQCRKLYPNVRLSDQIVDLIEGGIDLAVGSAIWPKTDVGPQPL